MVYMRAYKEAKLSFLNTINLILYYNSGTHSSKQSKTAQQCIKKKVSNTSNLHTYT